MRKRVDAKGFLWLCEKDKAKERKRRSGRLVSVRVCVCACLPFLSSFSRSTSGKPVSLTWEFYLRLDFLRLALHHPLGFPLQHPTPRPSPHRVEARRLSSNGRSATRSDLIRITDATMCKTWKDSRTFYLFYLSRFPLPPIPSWVSRDGCG